LAFGTWKRKYASEEHTLYAMLTCEIDSPMTTAIGSDLSLDRSQTIMTGDSHCDFKWKMQGS